MRSARKERTERLLFLQDANDDTKLDQEVERGSGGGPDDSQDEEPVVVQLAGRIRLEVAGDGQARVEGDVARANEEDDNSGLRRTESRCQSCPDLKLQLQVVKCSLREGSGRAAFHPRQTGATGARSTRASKTAPPPARHAPRSPTSTHNCPRVADPPCRPARPP